MLEVKNLDESRSDAKSLHIAITELFSTFRAVLDPLEYTQPYPVVKRYHNRFWSCFSRFESWPGSLDGLTLGKTLRSSERAVAF